MFVCPSVFMGRVVCVCVCVRVCLAWGALGAVVLCTDSVLIDPLLNKQ